MMSVDKKKRLLAICKILANEHISNQNQLVEALETQGFTFNQSTISRDLRALGIRRVREKGSFKYVLPFDEMKKLAKIHVDYPLSHYELRGSVSANGAVVNTREGEAKAVAHQIDKMKRDDIAGTIAGEDTILILHHVGADPYKILEELEIPITSQAVRAQG